MFKTYDECFTVGNVGGECVRGGKTTRKEALGRAVIGRTEKAGAPEQAKSCHYRRFGHKNEIENTIILLQIYPRHLLHVCTTVHHPKKAA